MSVGALSQHAARSLVLLACASAALGAQDIDRSKRPETPPPPTFKFPKVASATLPNGLHLLVVEDHALPLVAVRAVIGADSTMDPVGKEGLYALTLGAMREGTTSKNANQLAESFADIGAAVTPTAFTTTTAGFATGLSLMADMLEHPAFEQPGIDRRKAIQAAAAKRIAQSPTSAPRHLFNAALYGAENGYVRSLVPTEASIGSLTHDDLVAFHDRYVRPQLATVIVVGDVTAASVLAEAKKAFGAWERGSEAPRAESATVPAKRPTTIYLLDTQSPQAYVYVGGAGPSRDANDYIVADVMGAISGTRMVQTLRERRSFMYSGASGIIARRAPLVSSFVGSAAINASKVDSALVEWIALLKGLSTGKPVSPQELEATRRNRVGILPARIEGPDSVAIRVSELVRDNVPLTY
ncbi:MAG TPA: pitrilysin family protein, partial [Gemmatimonadaceae bacterium]